MDICKTVAPEQKEIEKGHYVVCHLFDDVKAYVDETLAKAEPAKEATAEE